LVSHFISKKKSGLIPVENSQYSCKTSKLSKNNDLLGLAHELAHIEPGSRSGGKLFQARLSNTPLFSVETTISQYVVDSRHLMPRFPHILRLPSKLKRRARRSRLATLISLVLITALLLAPCYIIYKPPAILISYFEYRWPDVLWRVSAEAKIVALTIDDAPSEYTGPILELLNANNATATFFVIGAQMPGRERILEDLVRGGNELGNHAMHDEPSRSLSDAKLTEEILAVERSINAVYLSVRVGGRPKYFRPGSGFFSSRLRAILKKLGYHLVLGNIYPHDPQIPSPWLNSKHILSMIRPGGIIVCHDRRGWTLPMLKKVLPELKRKGYSVVTVTKLLKEQMNTRV
jgi:peptidoglycan/xylan/chitin deacetylase (PgdA/CDA1 family)